MRDLTVYLFLWFCRFTLSLGKALGDEDPYIGQFGANRALFPLSTSVSSTSTSSSSFIPSRACFLFQATSSTENGGIAFAFGSAPSSASSKQSYKYSSSDPRTQGLILFYPLISDPKLATAKFEDARGRTTMYTEQLREYAPRKKVVKSYAVYQGSEDASLVEFWYVPEEEKSPAVLLASWKGMLTGKSWELGSATPYNRYGMFTKIKSILPCRWESALQTFQTIQTGKTNSKGKVRGAGG